MGEVGGRLWGWLAEDLLYLTLDLVYRPTSPALQPQSDKAIKMAIGFGAMMMHRHHHRTHNPTVETMLWSK